MSSASAPLGQILTADQRLRLESAHAQLRRAVQAYARFRGQHLGDSTVTVVVQDAIEMGQAQAEIEAAEATLWKVREEVLGWARPSHTPGASLVADWFSDEDADYDDLGDETQRPQ